MGNSEKTGGLKSRKDYYKDIVIPSSAVLSRSTNCNVTGGDKYVKIEKTSETEH